MKTQAEIKYLRYEFMYGRSIAAGTLHVGGQQVAEGRLSELLTIVDQQQFELVNAQEILNSVVRINGFAS